MDFKVKVQRVRKEVMKTIYFLSALCLLVGTNSQAQIQASDSAQIAEVFLVRGPVRPDRGGERNRGPGLDDRRRSGDDRRRESIRRTTSKSQ